MRYVWLRPAQYRSAARVEIAPAVTAAPGAPSAPVLTLETESARPFLTELQILTSRPVVAEVAARLASAGENLAPFGPDPIAGIQSHLEAVPVEKTNVVELIATGPSAGVLAPVVNTTIAVYRERLAQSYQASSSEALADADDEVKRLETLVATKRRDLEAFRLRHNIVSLERGENQVLAQVRSLGTSLSVANDKVAAAEGKVRALTESAAAGSAVARSRDDPTLGDLEQRASQARVELRDMERVYTQDFLAREPKAIALRTRLAELERQIQSQREASQKAALAEAKEELAGATSAATRLQSQTRLRTRGGRPVHRDVSTNTSRVRTTWPKSRRPSVRRPRSAHGSRRANGLECRRPISSKRPARRASRGGRSIGATPGLQPAARSCWRCSRCFSWSSSIARSRSRPSWWSGRRAECRTTAGSTPCRGRTPRSSRWAARSLRCWPRSRSCRASSIAPTWRGC